MGGGGVAAADRSVDEKGSACWAACFVYDGAFFGGLVWIFFEAICSQGRVFCDFLEEEVGLMGDVERSVLSLGGCRPYVERRS